MTTSGKSLADLAELVGGRVVGDPDVAIEGVASIEDAGPGDITFFAHPRYRRHLASCNAGAVIVADEPEGRSGLNLLRVDDPSRAFARIHGLFNPPAAHDAVTSPLAFVHPTAVVGTDTPSIRTATSARTPGSGTGRCSCPARPSAGARGSAGAACSIPT